MFLLEKNVCMSSNLESKIPSTSILRTLFPFNKNHTYRLRPILIDGQNVAVAHGKEIARGFDSKIRFSARGIQIVVKYFVERGHQKNEVVVWLPEILKDKVDKVIIITTVRGVLSTGAIGALTPAILRMDYSRYSGYSFHLDRHSFG